MNEVQILRLKELNKIDHELYYLYELFRTFNKLLREEIIYSDKFNFKWVILEV